MPQIKVELVLHTTCWLGSIKLGVQNCDSPNNFTIKIIDLFKKCKVNGTLEGK